MGWRENMGILKTKTPSHYSQNTQKEQTKPENSFFANNANNANAIQKIKNTSTPPPDLSKIRPEHTQEYTALWYQAHALADFVDDSSATPYEERAEKLPELNTMVERMRTIENMLNADAHADPSKSTLPVGWSEMTQSPVFWIREEKKTWPQDTCGARCKRTGKCYGVAYHDCKPGSVRECLEAQCPWIEKGS